MESQATGRSGKHILPHVARTRPGRTWPEHIGTVGPAGSTTLATEHSALLASVLVEMPKSTRPEGRLQNLDHRLKSQGSPVTKAGEPPTRSGSNGPANQN
eukprot:5248477-Amphidinium_carterae.1